MAGRYEKQLELVDRYFKIANSLTLEQLVNQYNEDVKITDPKAFGYIHPQYRASDLSVENITLMTESYGKDFVLFNVKLTLWDDIHKN